MSEKPNPLKSQLDVAIGQLKLQIQSLERYKARFLERDKSLLQRVVHTHTKHDMTKANILAKELKYASMKR